MRTAAASPSPRARFRGGIVSAVLTVRNSYQRAQSSSWRSSWPAKLEVQILRNPLLDAMVLSWARQVAALAKKELLLLLRAPKKSVTELVAPVLVVVLLGILNVSVSYPSPEVGTQAIDRLASDATVRSDEDGGAFQCRVFDDRVGKYGYGLQIPSFCTRWPRCTSTR